VAEYYVRSTGGSDGNTGLSFAQGWATLAYAYATIPSGSTLYICSTESSPFSLTSIFSVGASLLYIGANLTDGSPYNGTGKAHIRADAGITALVRDDFSYWTKGNKTLWQDICFNGNNKATYSFYLYYASDISDLLFRGCDFKNAITNGIYIKSDSTPATFLGGTIGFHSCNFYDNAYGVYTYGASNYLSPILFNNCAFYGNSTSNCYFWYDAHVTMFNCRIFRSGGNGIDWIWGT